MVYRGSWSNPEKGTMPHSDEKRLPAPEPRDKTKHGHDKEVILEYFGKEYFHILRCKLARRVEEVPYGTRNFKLWRKECDCPPEWIRIKKFRRMKDAMNALEAMKSNSWDRLHKHGKKRITSLSGEVLWEEESS